MWDLLTNSSWLQVTIPTIVTSMPTSTWDLTPVLELGSHQLPTLESTYSLSLIYYFSLTLPSCVSIYVHIALLCFSLTPPLPPTLALPHCWYSQLIICSSTLYIRLSFLYNNVHVQISALILTSLSTWPHLWSPNLWLLVSGLPEIILCHFQSSSFTLNLYAHLSGLCSVPD